MSCTNCCKIFFCLFCLYRTWTYVVIAIIPVKSFTLCISGANSMRKYCQVPKCNQWYESPHPSERWNLRQIPTIWFRGPSEDLVRNILLKWKLSTNQLLDQMDKDLLAALRRTGPKSWLSLHGRNFLIPYQSISDNWRGAPAIQDHLAGVQNDKHRDSYSCGDVPLIRGNCSDVLTGLFSSVVKKEVTSLLVADTE